MSFTGIAFEMAAIDDGMSKAVDKATELLGGINDMLEKQVEKIKSVKKEDFYKGIDRGSKAAAKSVQWLKGEFGMLSYSVSRFAKDSASSIGGLAKSAKDGFGKIGQHMKSMQQRVMQFNIADIASNMHALTGETGNLSNALESTMAGMMQTTKPIIAGLNLSSAEMKKLSARAASMAYGMNTDAGAVAETMKSMRTASDGAKASLDALGMSEKDWVKVVQTTNMKMEDYTGILGDLTTSWSMAPKKAAQLVNSLVDIGKKAGVGTLALQGTKENLASIREIFGKLPPGMQRTSDEIYNLVESAARGAGVFKEFGASEQDAVANSNAVAKMFAEQSVVMQKAFEIGGEGAALENSPLFKYLTQLGLGYEGARDIIDTGSRDVVAGMKKINDLYASLGGSQLLQAQQALGGLNESLGAGAKGLEFLAMSTDKGSAAIDKFANLSVKGDGALKQFGKDAYSSGITLQETYDRAKLAFDSTIRSIARTQVVGLVKKQMQGMKEAGQEIKALAGDETWGPWVNAMSQFKQMGMSGVFASLAESTGIGAKNAAKFGSKVGLIFDTVGDISKEMAPVMHMLGMAGPLGGLIAAGGIAGLLVMDESSQKDILGPMYGMFDNLKKKAIGIWDTFGPSIKKGWNEKVEPSLKSFWTDRLVPYLQQKAPDIGKALWGAVKFAWDQVGTMFGTEGQFVVGLGLALKTGLLGPVVGLGTTFAGEVMKGLGKGGINGGLIGLAAMAGSALGLAIGDKLTTEQDLSKATNEARKMLKKPEDSLIMYARMIDSGGKDEQYVKNLASQFEKARSIESESWFPDRQRIDDLTRALSLLAQARTELNIEKSSAGVMGMKTSDFGGRMSIQDALDADLNSIETEGVLLAGQTTADQFLSGISTQLVENKGQVEQAIDAATQSIQAHSPIAEGPLSGEQMANAAYRGGMFTMEQFAQGIYDSTDMVASTVTQLMEDAVITSIDVYATKMKELAEQKSLLESVAKSMVRDLGGKLDMTPDPEANVNIKKNFEAALSVPGLAGVILAITNEGAQNRKMMKRMLDESMRQTAIMSGQSPAVVGGGTAIPAP